MISYGLIGCGMMGREHIHNILLLEDTQVAWICEPDADMRAQAQAIVPNAISVDDPAELIAIRDLGALVIVSPNYLHAEHLALIKSKPNLPVLVEKPLITDWRDQALIDDLQANHKAPIWVAMEYRYMPPVAALIDQAADFTGGIKMLTIQEHRFPFLEKVGDWNRFNAKSGGTFVEKCCHFFDLMRLILKSDPVRVYASAGQAHNHLDEVYDGQASDIWDHGYVTVDFQSGARAQLELCMFAEGSEYQEMITAMGPEGKIECLVPGPGRFWPTELGAAPVSKLIKSPRRWLEPKPIVTQEIKVPAELLAAGDHNGSTFYQHQGFQSSILNNEVPEVSLTDGLWAVRMGLAAQESAQSGQAVIL